MLAILFVVGFAYFLLIPVVFGGGLRKNLFNPVRLFLLAYGFAYFFVPAFALFGGGLVYQSEYRTSTWLAAFGAHIVFCISAVGVFYVLNGTQKFKTGWQVLHDFSHWISMRNSDRRMARVVFLAPAIFSATVLVGLIQSYGYGPFLVDRIRIMSGRGYIIMPLSWIGVYGVIVAADLAIRPAGSTRWPRKFELVCVPMAAALSGPLIGSRASALWPLLWVVLSYAMLRGGTAIRWARIIKLCLLGMAVLAFGVGLGSVRRQVSGGADNLTLGLPSADIAGSVSRGLLEAFPDYENPLWLIENRGSYDPLLGSTFAAAAVGYVPRSIWPAKPLGGGPHLRNMIHPGSYDLSSASGLTSYTTGLPAEALMNFGYPGFILVGALYGFILWCLAATLPRVSTPLGYAFWFFCYFYSIALLSAEAFGTMAHLFSAIIPIFFCLVLRSLRRHASHPANATQAPWPNLADAAVRQLAPERRQSRPTW